MEPVHLIKIILDIIATCLLILIYIYLTLFAEPFKTSFYCNDYSINMPFKSSTVTNLHLYIICFVLPLTIFLFTEVIRAIYFHFEKNVCTKNAKKCDQKSKKLISSSMSSSASSTDSSNSNSCEHRLNRQRYIYKIALGSNKKICLPEELGNLYINCGSFFVGLMSTAVLTDFMKIVVGRLRPNFLDVCKPDRNVYTDLCMNSNRTYLIPEIDFKCLTHDRPSISESRKSFPSGHASLSFYSIIFLILFINFTWNCRRLGLLPKFVQLFLFMLAIFSSITRYIDNKHHTSDIIAGCILGTLLGLTTFFYLTDFLKKSQYKVRYYTNSKSRRDQRKIDEEKDFCSRRNSSGCMLFGKNEKHYSDVDDIDNNDENHSIPLTNVCPLAKMNSINELDNSKTFNVPKIKN